MKTTVRTSDELKSALISSTNEIFLSAGKYYLTEPVTISCRDGLTLTAEKGAVLIGGLPKTVEWKNEGGSLYSTDMSIDNFDGLTVGGRKFIMARYPHYNEEIRMLHGYASDAVDFAAKCEDPTGAYIHGIHEYLWGSEHFLVTGRNDDGSLKLEGGWQNNTPKPLHWEYRYVENLREALGQDGEFYYNKKEGKLYICSDAEPSAEIEIITNPYLLKFIGCSDVRISGLTFGATARTFMADYERLLRSDWSIHRGGALYFEDCISPEVHGCEFTECGSTAVFVNGNVQGAQITECLFHELDASCICFVGKPDCVRDSRVDVGWHTVDDMYGVGPISDNYPRNCVVENCVMTNFGLVEKQVAGVQISMSRGITVRRCSIYHCPRAAVNIGEGTFGGHVVEYCDLYDTVRETGDHGSFNGWGRDRFWRARDGEGNNLSDSEMTSLMFRDAIDTTYLRFNRVKCEHGWDIDLDDGCSNYVVEGNLCLSGGIKLREGFCRKVRNNICVGNTIHVHVWFGESGDVITDNIVWRSFYPIGMPDKWGRLIDRNILHKPGFDGIGHADELSKISGQDENSVVCDACFTDTDCEVYSAENPALTALGFTQPTVGSYGVQSVTLRNWMQARKRGVSVEVAVDVEEKSNETASFCGMTVRNIESDSEMSAYGVGGHNGCIVVDIEEGSVFSGVFVKGDLIRFVGDLKVRDCAHFSEILNAASGETFFTAYHAGGEVFSAEIRI